VSPAKSANLIERFGLVLVESAVKQKGVVSFHGSFTPKTAEIGKQRFVECI